MTSKMAALIEKRFSKFLLVLCFIVVSLSSVQSQRYSQFEKDYTRNLSELVVDPGCGMAWCHNSSYTGGVLTHIVAAGPQDELHHLFCTIGAPSLMISRTHKGTKLVVDYQLFNDPRGQEAINYTAPPQHSFGMIFPNIYEYDDWQDTAKLSDYKTNSSANLRHRLTDLDWQVITLSSSDSTRTLTINATSSSTNHTLLDKGGYLSFVVRYDSKDGRLETRPHMEYTSNTSIVTVVMHNLVTSFEHSRFALEMVMFSTEDADVCPAQSRDATQVTLARSLDDEYSPGVFEMTNWHANLNKSREDAWGYAQWKPVVYTKPTRLNADLSDALSYPNLNRDKDYILFNILPSRSLFTLYFGANDTADISLNATNVSYGITNDKFFTNTKYLVWTMSVGMGPAPEDDVSTLVILVIAVGLGIPLVLMIVSAVFVCVKNMRSRQKEMETYTPIST